MIHCIYLQTASRLLSRRRGRLHQHWHGLCAQHTSTSLHVLINLLRHYVCLMLRPFELKNGVGAGRGEFEQNRFLRSPNKLRDSVCFFANLDLIVHLNSLATFSNACRCAMSLSSHTAWSKVLSVRLMRRLPPQNWNDANDQVS